MRYHFDPAKRLTNLKKHGYDFADAKWVIEGDRPVTFEDNRFDYDEPRFVTLGMLNDVVVGCNRGNGRRNPRHLDEKGR